MSTPKQIAANRRNAQLSTGPKTVAGKIWGSRNALQHGMLAIVELPLPWESREALAELYERMNADWEPQTFTEMALVENMVADMWRLRRFQRAESGMEVNNALTIPSRVAEAAEAARKGPPKVVFDPEAFAEVPPESFPEPQEEAPEVRDNVYLYRVNTGDLGMAFVKDVMGPDALAKLRRYRTSLENSFYRTLHELQRLQAMRKGTSAPASEMCTSPEMRSGKKRSKKVA